MENTVPVLPEETRERQLDWITGLFPVWVLAICYFRMPAVALPLLAWGGYAAAAQLIRWAGLPMEAGVPGALCALILNFFLPASAPLWLPVLGGGAAALLTALPGLLSKKWPDRAFSRPLLHPALTAFLAVSLLFPAYAGRVTEPVMWQSGTGEAVPALMGLFDPTAVVERTRLFLGVCPGKMGLECVPVILLAAAYLLLRRRLRLIAPAAMLGTVSLLSLAVWHSPLYGLLAGGSVLGALLLGDKAAAPEKWQHQLAAGVLAGGVTVLLRATFHADGTALAVVLSLALTPVYGPAIGATCRGFRWIFRFFQEKIKKSEKN